MPFTLIESMGSEPPAPGAVEHDVRTRDGAVLATDVYLPPGAGTHDRFPAILVRTPYDKSSRYTAISAEATYFTGRGYAYVAQDVRGKFHSTGATEPYLHDVADGYDTAEWIVGRPWSDGTIGVVGASYYGFTAWAAVASGHPAIRAAVPQVTGIDMGDRHVASRWRQDVPALAATNDLLQIWTDRRGYLADIDWSSRAPAEVIDEWRRGVGESSGATALLERSRDQGWFNPYGDRHPHHTTGIPILHWQNWYDPGLAPEGLRDWRHFRTLPGSRDLHYLRAGSADHSGFLLADVGAGDAANPYLDDAALARKISSDCAEMAEFFDEHVRGIAPTHPRPRARRHVGHEGWRESEEYPPPNTPYALHLTADGRLAADAQGRADSLTWVHDPDAPVPSATEMEGLWYLLAAYPDERERSRRPDVLTFSGETLDDDVVFAGQPVLEAQVTIDSESAHVFATLQDVEPDGTTRPISWGRLVLRSMTGSGIRLQLDDNAYRLRAGHRLQLQLHASDYPYYVVHPGTDENPWFRTRTRRVALTLGVGGSTPARLILPQISPL